MSAIAVNSGTRATYSGVPASLTSLQPLYSVACLPKADMRPASAEVSFDPKRSSGFGGVAIATFRPVPLRKV